MSEVDRQEIEIAAEEEPIDLDTDATEELEVAMREALEAIESGQSAASEAGKPDIQLAEPEGADDVLSTLQREAEEHRDLALRSRADLENYRKRVQRERQEESRFKAFEPMRSFLTVIDNLERALVSPGSVEDLKQGVEMILRQMGNLLRDNGVERIEALGQGFDPSLHEAVSRDEDASVEVPTVSEEMQAGYTMHGRLLRPAVVKVAMPASQAGAAGDDEV